MNQVKILWHDDNDGRLEINGQQAVLYKVATGKLLKDAKEQRHWAVAVCFDYNQSNRIVVTAATLPVLCKKIAVMGRVLPYRYT